MTDWTHHARAIARMGPQVVGAAVCELAGMLPIPVRVAVMDSIFVSVQAQETQDRQTGRSTAMLLALIDAAKAASPNPGSFVVVAPLHEHLVNVSAQLARLLDPDQPPTAILSTPWRIEGSYVHFLGGNYDAAKARHRLRGIRDVIEVFYDHTWWTFSQPRDRIETARMLAASMRPKKPNLIVLPGGST